MLDFHRNGCTCRRHPLRELNLVILPPQYQSPLFEAFVQIEMLDVHMSALEEIHHVERKMLHASEAITIDAMRHTHSSNSVFQEEKNEIYMDHDFKQNALGLFVFNNTILNIFWTFELTVRCVHKFQAQCQNQNAERRFDKMQASVFEQCPELEGLIPIGEDFLNCRELRHIIAHTGGWIDGYQFSNAEREQSFSRWLDSRMKITSGCIAPDLNDVRGYFSYFKPFFDCAEQQVLAWHKQLNERA